MKKVILLNMLLMFSAVNWNSYGQELEPTKCHPGIDQYGFKDKNSDEIVISCSYKKVWNFSEQIEGLAKVSQNIAPPQDVRAKLKYGFIDKNGKEVVPLKYDEIYKFSEQIEGLALVKFGDFYGFIDKMGKEVIRPKYSNNVFKFSEGLAVVRVGSLYGFIDKTGNEVIPCKYNYAENFSRGIALVKLMADNGYIDVTGEFFMGSRDRADRKVTDKKAKGAYNAIFAQIEQANETEKQRLSEAKEQERRANEAREREAREKREMAEKTLTFSYFAKNYVESKINIWQQKGEYEPTADWKKRVNDDTRMIKANEFYVEAKKVYTAERSKNFNVGNMSIHGDYDADNHVYLIKNSIHGDWLVPVPIIEAPNFRKSWDNIRKTPQYDVINDKLAITEMYFTTSEGKTYKYSNQDSLNYTVTNIDYNFAPIDINIGSNQNTPQGKQNISTVGYSIGNQSDVASNIPATGAKNDLTFAVIIANENYQTVSKVEFAKNDGETFKKYCTRTLGLPEKNVHFIADATLNNIRGQINWLNDLSAAYKGEASIIFYYAGHGIPDEGSRTSYLLPVDGLGSDFRTGYKLDELYQELGGMTVKRVTVFMDACFSGAQRSGEMMAVARGVAIKTTQGVPVGNMIVFSAAQGDETAFPYQEKGHGMFTYFLLKKMQETKGETTLGELGDYIETNVRQQSIVVNKKSQTPTVIPSATMVEKWRELKLK